VKVKLDAGSKLVIVDSRSNAGYEQSHIVGAISLPLGNMAEPYSDLNDYDEIAFY
jgi:rhodanese-related sulfurtransferase